MPQRYTFIFIYKLYNLKKIVIFAPKTKKTVLYAHQNSRLHLYPNMRRTTLFFILLLQVITMAGQKTVQQKGMTYKYNGKKAHSPLGNVYLKFGTTANNVLSDSVTGEFTVLFRDLKMGDRVGSVTAYKNEIFLVYYPDLLMNRMQKRLTKSLVRCIYIVRNTLRMP